MSCSLWFGTEEYMQWVETPLSGSSSNSEAWEAESQMLNGGVHIVNSWGSHKVYDFSWRNSSARQAAQLMKSYRDGTWGRGLIHFVDPLIYDTNVLPARWADPSMVLDYEGPSHVTGITPSRAPQTGFKTNQYPVNAVKYDLSSTTPGHREGDSVFIPIPEGYVLWLGSVNTATGTGGVYYSPVTGGITGTAVKLPALAPDSRMIANHMVPGGVDGIRLWVGRSSGIASTVTVGAMTGRLVKATRNNPGWTEATAPAALLGPWIGGQGNSGCRFSGVPTYVEYTGVNGGQVGYAATFKEVGTWA